ncbi:peptide ABC transporter permease [Paenibacillus elgii]|uniref:Peptide ABC transporter permease n=1 Tax=Paenibacillus elgii TaxID=189691 RepID=A0A2T6G8M0_9BACL|nr:oligopeptide ABC transporter permease [Paenibacillus elgii]PUA40503.1 peptide ABC transporter permease [Paenibacillus elgii]
MNTATKPLNQTIPIGKKRSASPWVTGWSRFFHNKLAVASLAFLVLIAVLCALAPLLTSYDPVKINLRLIHKPPSVEHLLGTDKGGRDIIARLLYGGRTTLMIAVSISFLVTFIGVSIGSVAGYFGGKIDNMLMRFTDFIMIFPFLIFVIVLKTVIADSGVLVLIVVISVLGWGGIARLVRSKVLAEKENEYIMSAVAIGCKPFQVIVKHLLPNVASTIIVQAIVVMAVMIGVETGLSFLGFGVPANVPSWGNMMSDAISPQVIKNQWWVWLPSAVVITSTILAINFIGEGAKEAFDPKG